MITEPVQPQTALTAEGTKIIQNTVRSMQNLITHNVKHLDLRGYFHPQMVPHVAATYMPLDDTKLEIIELSEAQKLTLKKMFLWWLLADLKQHREPRYNKARVTIQRNQSFEVQVGHDALLAQLNSNSRLDFTTSVPKKKILRGALHWEKAAPDESRPKADGGEPYSSSVIKRCRNERKVSG